MAADEDCAISCRGLSKSFGSRTVVDSLDLAVRPDSVFGFLGPNGAGKTTTIRMLLGFVRPTAGDVRLFGHRPPVPTRVLSVGALVEEPSAYPWLSGRSNLQVLADYGPPLGRSAVDEALDRVRLLSAAGQKVETYSQGMRQRLGLAAALLRRPRVLILDEPANGLDPQGIADFRSLIRGLAQDGCTVFLSSHQLHEVERLCDDVAVLNEGRLVASGSVRAIVASSRWVRITLREEDVSRARAALPEAQREAAGSLLLAPGADRRQALQRMAAVDVYPETVELVGGHLEEMFLRMTVGASGAPATR